jgi:hypothetical protein
VFDASAVEFFHRLTKRKQRRVLDRAHELASDPFLLPDFRSTDDKGREIGHVLADDFIFDYWIDHAERRLVITEIELVD